LDEFLSLLLPPVSIIEGRLLDATRFGRNCDGLIGRLFVEITDVVLFIVFVRLLSCELQLKFGDDELEFKEVDEKLIAFCFETSLFL